MATLTGISEDVKSRRIDLETETITVGRTDKNILPLDNPTVSSSHAEIVHGEEGYTLRDLGSTNGTRLNARDIKEILLSPKDVIQFGSVEFLFDDESDERGPRQDTLSSTQVTEDTGAGVRPESFDSISPFGSNKKESKNFMFVLIILIGLLALGVVVYYFMELISAT